MGIRCEDCRRRFGGTWGYKLAHPPTLGRCRTEDELRTAGLHRNRRGMWVRRHSRFQPRLIDGRVPGGSLVRRMYGKAYRSLSASERSEYHRAARRTRGARTGRDDGERNAARPTGVAA